MSFKQVLGIAFKQWSKDHCYKMLNSNNKLANTVAKYVLAKKFNNHKTISYE